ncbi:MAG: glycosyltransferase family 4 protein [Myxococcaceae bacterium]|nr:glycosyltransferase family 4 protein [Myxococcaceae bacterium]
MLVIHPHFHGRRTGVTAHTESLVKALAPHVEVFALGRSLQSRVPQLSWGQLLRRLGQEPAIWHAHRNNELMAGLALRLFFPKLRVVFSRHGHGVPGRYTRFLAARADQRVTLTHEGSRLLSSSSEVVPHGVSLERFTPPEDRQGLWRGHRLGGEYGIGVVGRIRVDKGQGDFVKAVAPLLEAFSSWRAVLVGLARGPDVAWADRLRAQTNGQLVLAGEHADVVPWYQSLSIVVQPSHAESFGLVMLEAMASGCCLVTSALPHVAQYVEHGRTGFIYPVGDSDALQRILRELMNEPLKAKAVGEAAARAAQARFGIAREAQTMQALYEKLLAK